MPAAIRTLQIVVSAAPVWNALSIRLDLVPSASDTHGSLMHIAPRRTGGHACATFFWDQAALARDPHKLCLMSVILPLACGGALCCHKCEGWKEERQGKHTHTSSRSTIFSATSRPVTRSQLRRFTFFPHVRLVTCLLTAVMLPAVIKPMSRLS